MDNIHLVKETTLTVEKKNSSPRPSIPWFNILQTSTNLKKSFRIIINYCNDNQYLEIWQN